MARVLFVQTEWFEHLGILWLAAAARQAGHSVGILVGRRPGKMVARLLAADPEVVAFSATTGAHRAALAIAAQLRPRFPGKILLGGPHPTFFPEVIAEPALDAICRGEGERALVDFLGRLDRGEDLAGVPGFWVKAGGEVQRNPVAELIADLDTLPPPARDLLEAADPWFRRDTMQRVMAGRGCPYRCSYCFNQAMQTLVRGKGPYVRTRSVGHVLAELREIKRRGKRTINFVDDTFGLNRSWTLEFLDRYRAEIGLPFIVNLRPEQADAQLSRALAAAGCYCAQMGVESAREPLRRRLLGRAVSDEVLAEGARRLKESGIKLLTYNMVGLPGESLADAAATLEWNGRMGVDFPRVSIFQPYPRTLLGDQVLSGARADESPPPAEGEGDSSAVADACSPAQVRQALAMAESYFRSSPLAGLPVRRIENLHKLFHLYVRCPRLRPLLLRLCRLPANPLFDLVFLVSIGLQYRGATNRGLAETLRLGLRNLRAYFS